MIQYILLLFTWQLQEKDFKMITKWTIIVFTCTLIAVSESAFGKLIEVVFRKVLLFSSLLPKLYLLWVEIQKHNQLFHPQTGMQIFICPHKIVSH